MGSSAAADVQSLKDALASQQLQIERLTEQLQRQQAWQQAQKSADAASTKSVPQQQVAEITTGADIQPEAISTPAAQNPQDTTPTTSPSSMEGPLTIHFKGINITPGGYAAAEFVRRSRALGADLPTPFNSLTMPGASQSDVSEFFGSARQSKITTFVNGRLDNVDLSAYVSADFLSAGVTSTSTSTFYDAHSISEPRDSGVGARSRHFRRVHHVCQTHSKCCRWWTLHR